VPEITLTWVSGYRRSYRGRNDAPSIRSITHAPDQTYIRPQPLHCLFRSHHLHAVVDYCLDRNDFHRVSRAEGPSQLTWMIGRKSRPSSRTRCSVTLLWRRPRESACRLRRADPLAEGPPVRGPSTRRRCAPPSRRRSSTAGLRESGPCRQSAASGLA